MEFMDEIRNESHPKKNLQSLLLCLYETETDTDMQLDVKWRRRVKEFKAHRLILCMRSLVFADQFRDKQRFSHVTFTIIGVHPRIIEHLLWYLYSDYLKTETIEELTALAKVGNHFQIGGLQNKCREKLSDYVPDQYNACVLLEAAIDLDIKSLHEECMKIITEIPNEILKFPQFTKTSSSTASVILKITSPLISRADALDAAFRWIRHNKKLSGSILLSFNTEPISPEEFLCLMEKFPFFLKTKESAIILANMWSPDIVELPSWYRPDSERNYDPTALCTLVASLADECLRLHIPCNISIHQCKFFGNNNFKGSTTIALKQSKDFSSPLTLTMLEIAFGSDFVPVDILKLQLFRSEQQFSQIKKRKLKFHLHSTPKHYYVVLKENIEFHKEFPFIFNVTVKAKNLRQWTESGPVSDYQYRVGIVPENVNYQSCLTTNGNQCVYLLSLSDWLVFVDTSKQGKHFLFTALYFKSVSNLKLSL